jgi:hypothetical protein
MSDRLREFQVPHCVQAVEFPLKNDGFVSELKGSKAPAALQLSPVSPTAAQHSAWRPLPAPPVLSAVCASEVHGSI